MNHSPPSCVLIFASRNFFEPLAGWLQDFVPSYQYFADFISLCVEALGNGEEVPEQLVRAVNQIDVQGASVA